MRNPLPLLAVVYLLLATVDAKTTSTWSTGETTTMSSTEATVTSYSTTSPATTDTTTSPATTGYTTSPATTDTTTSPATTDTTTSPVTTDTTTSPATTDTTTSPVTTDTTTSPATTVYTTFPMTTDHTTSPATTDSTTSPATTVYTTFPVTTDTTNSPATTVYPTPPATTDTTNSPVFTDHTTSPSTNDTTTSPVTTVYTTPPATTGTKTFPVTTDTTTSPMTTDHTNSPVTTDNAAFPAATFNIISPMTTFNTTSPMASYNTTFPATTDNTTPPATTDNTTPPATTDNTTPPATTDNTTPPATTDNTTPPATTDNTTPPATTDNTTPPATTDNTTPPATTDNTTPPATTDNTTPPATTVNTTPPATTDSLTPPPTTDNTTPPASTDNTTPPATTDNTTPPATTDNTTPPATTDNTTPPATTVVTNPPATTDNTTPPATTDNTTPPATTDNTTPPATTVVTTPPATTVVTTPPATTDNTTPPGTTDNTTPQATTVNTTFPATTDNTTPPATTDNTTPPATTVVTTPPATNDNTTPPATTDNTTPPATTVVTTPPATTDNTTPPATTDNTTPPATTDNTTPPATTVVTTPPATTDKTTPPATTDNTTPPATTDNTTPPATTDNTTPPATTDNTTPPATTDNTTPPATTDNTTPPATTDNTTPPATTDNTTPPATTDNTTPPAFTVYTTPPATTVNTTAPATTDNTTPPATTVITTPPATTDNTTPPATTDNTTPPATTDNTTPPATTDNTTPPATTDNTTSSVTSQNTTATSTKTTSSASTTSTTVATTAASSNARAGAEALFKFGYSEGDWALYGDDRLVYLYITRGFPTDSTTASSLHISTNGYIVFDRYYNSHYPRRFPYRDLKIVAPYWTDSTTYYYPRYCYSWYCRYYYYYTGSRVYYQVYTDGKRRYGDDASALFDRVNQLISSKRNVNQFTARWILKVTWYKMLLPNRLAMSTYQCILATDYQRSFTIFLYESGGLGWPTRSLSYTPGIGYQMGWRKYYNSPYSRRREAYRMDSIRGNTGKEGLWIFQLDDNRAGISPGLKCLLWYDNQTPYEMEYMRILDRRLSPCPCTVFQAFFDRRFRFAWWDKEYLEGNYCFYARLSPWGRTGSRKCCYRLRRIRRRYRWGLGWRYIFFLNTDIVTGGGLTRYNPVSFRQYRRYLDRDRSPFINCCVLSGYCGLYREFRRLNTCQGYRPPRRARFWGDPHITTLDGKGYTFNGWGEYTLLEVKNSTTGELMWRLQGRTDRARNAAGEMTDATIFTGFAAKDYETNATMRALLNGNKTDLNVVCNEVDYTLRFQNRSIDFDVNEDNLGCERPENMTLSVTFLSGISVNVSVGIELLEISVTVPEEISSSAKTAGLLGVFNNDQDDDFTFPNDTTISINSTEKEIFEFGQAWLISDQDSVFSYRWGMNASNYRHVDYTPKFLSDYNQTLVDAARSACAGNNECIFDYLSTNRLDIAQSTLNTANATQEEGSILSNNIPTITLERTTIEATVGTEVSLEINASDADDEVVTIYLVENITGNSNINQTGNSAIFTWTPVSLDPVNIGFGGSDPNEGEAPAQNVRLLLCNGCSNHGECDFNQTDVTVQETSSNGTTFALVPCDCYDGWIGSACDEDYDGCSDEPCPTGTNCTDLTADQQQALNGTGYNCSDCPAGLEKIQSKCLDIDECNSTDSTCDQLCFNTDGSYNCACEDGYHLEGTSACIDNDECQRGVHNCSHRCTNVPGTYNCSCEDGYVTSDEGRTCTVDPDNNPCSGANLGCELCRRGTNGPECFCQSGYALSGTNCVDIDECETGQCQQSCENFDGSYRCKCFDGYKLLSDKITCEKCDSLHYGPNCDTLCGCLDENYVECHHTRGCVCKSGWTGTDCGTDVDECATTQCGLLQKCTNSYGTYDCDCMDSYQNVSGQCTDIDECGDELLNNCTYSCVNVQGSFLCKCSAGYSGDGFTCNDVDECADQVTNCQHKCVNTEGSYTCDCYPGFELDDDRVSCTDVDKLCGNDAGGCNQICSVNETTSGIQCFCNPGFELANSTFCRDIDECKETVCSQTCQNTVGNFQCTCSIGYILGNDGKTCEECDGFHWGVDCQTDCNCGPGSPCNNTIGCICAPGWTGQRCDSDIKECEDSAICDQESLCVELLGSYRCDCQSGKQRVNGTCTDIDECATNTHDCPNTCINTDGSYICLCNPGYRSPQGDGKVCDDINECLGGDPCEALCTNTDGGSRCACYPGFTLNSDQLTCNRTSSELCGSQQLSCSYGCNNDTGKCFCANEHELQVDGFSCRAVRYRVKAKIILQLTFTADLTKTHTDAYRTMVHNIQEALRDIYKDVPNFKAVLVLELINGSVAVTHDVLFTTQASLAQTQGVTTALSTLFSNGAGLTVGGVTVAITTVPVLITAGGSVFLVNGALTCAADPCAYNEVCNDKSGVAACFPEGTTFADPVSQDIFNHRLAIGLSIGIPLCLVLVLIAVVLVVVKPWNKQGSMEITPIHRASPEHSEAGRQGSNSTLLGRRGSKVSPEEIW